VIEIFRAGDGQQKYIAQTPSNRFSRKIIFDAAYQTTLMGHKGKLETHKWWQAYSSVLESGGNKSKFTKANCTVLRSIATSS